SYLPICPVKPVKTSFHEFTGIRLMPLKISFSNDKFAGSMFNIRNSYYCSFLQSLASCSHQYPVHDNGLTFLHILHHEFMFGWHSGWKHVFITVIHNMFSLLQVG